MHKSILMIVISAVLVCIWKENSLIAKLKWLNFRGQKGTSVNNVHIQARYGLPN
jgi:hypothetical protein